MPILLLSCHRQLVPQHPPLLPHAPNHPPHPAFLCHQAQVLEITVGHIRQLPPSSNFCPLTPPFPLLGFQEDSSFVGQVSLTPYPHLKAQGPPELTHSFGMPSLSSDTTNI